MKISLYFCVRIKTIPWKFRTLNPKNSPFRCHVTNHAFLIWMFYTPWWRTMGSLKFNLPIFKVLAQSWRHFTSLKPCKGSQSSQPASRSSIKFQQKSTTICLTIYKHSKYTKLCHPARCCVGLQGRNSRKKKRNLSSRAIAHKSWMARCSPRTPLIVAEAINIMHLISIEQ